MNSNVNDIVFETVSGNDNYTHSVLDETWNVDIFLQDQWTDMAVMDFYLTSNNSVTIASLNYQKLQLMTIEYTMVLFKRFSD